MTESLFHYFLQADFIVKSVMLVLLGASILSWSLIIQRGRLLRQTRRLSKAFQQRFWSGQPLNTLYTDITLEKKVLTGLERVFATGFKEYTRYQQKAHLASLAVLKGVLRAMDASQEREIIRLEENMSLLATIGAVSPFVGLFGTVWGIMNAFQSLGHVQQASVAMVAPGISEALVATAMGLFAAIPAVIAYNRFNSLIAAIQSEYAIFQDEFANIIYRQSLLNSNETTATVACTP